MAKFLQPGEVVTFTPPGETRKPEGERIAYQVRVPSWAEEVGYDRETRLAGGRRWDFLALLKALEDGVTAVGGEGRDRAVAILRERRSQYHALILEAGDLDPVELLTREEAIRGAADLAEIEALIGPNYARYSAMEADNDVYARIRGRVAARLFLVGWVGIEGAVERGEAGCSEATLTRLPRKHVVAFGRFVDGLLRPSEPEIKNSESPSPTVSEETTLAAASTQP